MALKPDRIITDGEDISYYMNETSEAGSVVVFSGSGGVGGSPNDPDGIVQESNSTGDLFAGILMHDVVNIDLTRYKLNEFKQEVQIGSKVPVLRRGVVTTNKLVTGQTPSAGAAAYFAASGLLSTSAGSTRVGQFLGRKDTDGYVRVEIAAAPTRI